MALKMMHDNYCQENKNTQFHLKMLNSVVLPFVKYEKDNVSELEQLEKKQQEFFKAYLRRSAYDNIDEKMLYISDKLKHFKTGVMEESKSLHVLKYQAGFLSNQMCVEGHRVIETLGDKYLSLFKSCG